MKRAVFVALVLVAGCQRGGKKPAASAAPLADAAAPVAAPGEPPRPRGREIQLVIESRPTGALVSMDGKPIGKAPMGYFTIGDGREHDFHFTLSGHDDALVKMLLLRDGVVTGILTPHVVIADGGP